MNTRLPSLLAASLLATLFVSSLPAATPNHVTMAHPAGQTPPWEPITARGASRETVLDVLGSPSQAINASVWVYFDYRVQNARAHPGFDTLVVVFEGDKVLGMKLAESRVIRAVIAQRAAPAKGTLVVAAPARKPASKSGTE